ncbi:hypothetical protein YC2023_034561 [Brassica napus]
MLTDTPGLSATLKKLLVRAVVFLLWGERNSRLHNGSPASTSVLFSKIDRTLRDTLFASSVKSTINPSTPNGVLIFFFFWFFL